MQLRLRLTNAWIPRERALSDRCAATHVLLTEPRRRRPSSAFHSAIPSMDRRRENTTARGRVSTEGVGCTQRREVG